MATVAIFIDGGIHLGRELKLETISQIAAHSQKKASTPITCSDRRTPHWQCCEGLKGYRQTLSIRI